MNKITKLIIIALTMSILQGCATNNTPVAKSTRDSATEAMNSPKITVVSTKEQPIQKTKIKVPTPQIQSHIDKTSIETHSIISAPLESKTEFKVKEILKQSFVGKTEADIAKIVQATMQSGSSTQVNTMLAALFESKTEFKVKEILKQSFVGKTEAEIAAVVQAAIESKSRIQVKTVVSAMAESGAYVKIENVLTQSIEKRKQISMFDLLDKGEFTFLVMRLKEAKLNGNKEEEEKLISAISSILMKDDSERKPKEIVK